MVDEPTQTKPVVPEVEEHPIDETEAKKFAGSGDFNVAVSPLDELLGELAPAEPAAASAQPVPSTIFQPTTTESVPATPPEEPKTAEKKTGVVPPAGAKKEVAAPVDLEKQAKEMLKELDTIDPKKPKKKKSTFTSMALAAMLMVLMGAGGLVGMNLIRTQQVADTRSQAGGTGEGCTGSYTCKGACTGGLQKCYTNDRYPKECGTKVCDGYSRCQCCNMDGSTGWVVGQGSDCSKICTDNKWSNQAGNCDVEPTECYCESWSNGCGVNCHFPSGTQENVDAASKADCAPKIAMCNVSTKKVSIEDYGPGHVCYNKVDECKNPTADIKCSSPKPSVKPSPSPSPTPDLYACVSLTCNNTTFKLGDKVTLTCQSTGSHIDHYEFRYQIDGGAYQSIAASAAGANTSTPLSITKLGTYVAQCRVCRSTNSASCTVWGQANPQ